MLLRYRVQGSAADPYQVTFEGDGEHLAAFCSCPAGRRRLAFCKHMAAVLNGDTSKVTAPSDDITELVKRAKGSPLLEKANSHIASKRKTQALEKVESIIDIQNLIEPRISNTGCWVEYTAEQDGTEFLTVYMRKTYKNGKHYKNPTRLISISYQPIIYFSVYDEETNDIEEQAAGKRVKPYLVDSINYGTIGTAGAKFMEKLEKIVQELSPDL